MKQSREPRNKQLIFYKGKKKAIQRSRDGICKKWYWNYYTSKRGGGENLGRDLALHTKFKSKQIDHRSKWKIKLLGENKGNNQVFGDQF